MSTTTSRRPLAARLGYASFALACACATPSPDTAPPDAAPPTSASPTSATASVTALGDSGVSGEITFTEVEAGVEVSGTISGLEPGSTHGFHIHETGDCSAADGSSAGGHFNPAGHEHAGPDAASSHVGDLGNLVASDEGAATVRLTKAGAVLEGDAGIVGRGVIVHADADDLTSQPSGAAGARVACGVIEAP